jgi:type I restriction enzyme, S subunit
MVLSEIITSQDSGWSPQCEDRPALPNEWGVLKTTAVQWSGFDPQQNKALPGGLVGRPELEVRPGDVLITRAGPVNRVGVACSVYATPSRLMLSDKIVRVRPNQHVLSDYLVFALAALEAQEYFRQGKTGLAASQVNISREKLLNVTVAVPRIDEQQRIVNLAQDLLAKVILLKGVQNECDRVLEALLRSALDRAFKGEL